MFDDDIVAVFLLLLGLMIQVYVVVVVGGASVVVVMCGVGDSGDVDIHVVDGAMIVYGIDVCGVVIIVICVGGGCVDGGIDCTVVYGVGFSGSVVVVVIVIISSGDGGVADGGGVGVVIHIVVCDVVGIDDVIVIDIGIADVDEVSCDVCGDGVVVADGIICRVVVSCGVADVVDVVDVVDGEYGVGVIIFVCVDGVVVFGIVVVGAAGGCACCLVLYG